MNNIELKLIKEYVDKKVESGLPGTPGDSIIDVEKNQGNLIIYLSHYNTETGANVVTPVNLGSIIGPQGDKGQHGDGYTSIQINNNGDLIATKEVYSAQGSTPASQQINLGHVVGTDYVLTNADKEDIAEEAAGIINISNKADKATTLAGYGITDGESTSRKVTTITSSSTDAQYPSAKAVYTELSGKADKSDTYTKVEVDAAIQTAIGGVENGSY